VVILCIWPLRHTPVSEHRWALIALLNSFYIYWIILCCRTRNDGWQQTRHRPVHIFANAYDRV
jgi:hypothetical protein